MRSPSEDHIQVYVRALGDDTSFQYSRCIEICSRTSLNLLEQPLGPSIAQGFEKKDKIQNSPPVRESSPPSPPSPCIKSYPFSFTRIFYESESIDSISTALQLDSSQNRCIISLGRSDTLISKHGLIVKTLLQASESKYSIEVGCLSINSDKFTSLTNGYQRVESLTEILSLLFTLDYFNPRKTRDEINVTTVILTRDLAKTYVQFADIHQLNKGSDVLAKVLTNCHFSRDGSAQAKEPLVQALAKSICFGGKIMVIGNIYPTVPFIIQTRAILYYLDNVEKNKNRNKGAYIELLLKEVRKLQKNNEKLNNRYEEMSSQVMLLKDQLSTQYIQINQIDIEKKQLENEINQAREKNIIAHDEERYQARNILEGNESEIAELREENYQLHGLTAKYQEDLKETENKFKRIYERYTTSEKENGDLLQKIKELQYNADQTWKHVLKVESELTQYKSKFKDLEDQNKILKEKILEQESSKSANTSIAVDKISENEAEKIHLQYYEQIVVLNRALYAMKKHEDTIVNEAQAQYSDLLQEYRTRERFLNSQGREVLRYYLEEIEKHDLRAKEKSEEMQRIINQLEDNEKILREELEQQKKSNVDVKHEIHVFKNKLKEKAKCEIAEFIKKYEEAKEVHKKILNEKNQLMIEKNALIAQGVDEKAKIDSERHRFFEEKQLLLENIEKLKELREPNAKRAKKNPS